MCHATDEHAAVLGSALGLRFPGAVSHGLRRALFVEGESKVRKGGNPRNRNTQGVFCKIHDSLNSNLDLGLIIEERRGHFTKTPPPLSGPGWVGRPAHRGAHGLLACLPLAAARWTGLLLPRLGRQYGCWATYTAATPLLGRPRLSPPLVRVGLLASLFFLSNF